MVEVQVSAGIQQPARIQLEHARILPVHVHQVLLLLHILPELKGNGIQQRARILPERVLQFPVLLDILIVVEE